MQRNIIDIYGLLLYLATSLINSNDLSVEKKKEEDEEKEKPEL